MLLNNTEVLYASHFNESRPTKVIIHGFSDTGKEAWIRNLVDGKYLRHMQVCEVRGHQFCNVNILFAIKTKYRKRCDTYTRKA